MQHIFFWVADWLLLKFACQLVPVSLYQASYNFTSQEGGSIYKKREKGRNSDIFFTTILLGDSKTTDTKHLKNTTFAIKYVASNVIQWNEDNIFFEHYNPLNIMENWWLLWCSNTSWRQQFLRICSSLFSDDLLNRFSAFFKVYVWATTTREQMSSSAAQQNI